ncbi:Major facilitator superfamily domain [Trinorchestia longiramus]|nr:Major facilitator superfamily domain [Trinorchestia longiramus]
MDDNDPFEEDIVFDQAGLLGGKSTRNRHHHYNATGLLPTFMLFSRTLFLCVAFIGLGLCGSISRGPVIKVQEWLGVQEWEALHTFTAHSIGAFCGGLLGAKLFDRYNRQFLVFVSLVWVGISVSMLPFTIPVSLWWMRATLVAISAGIAFLFTGGNVLCLDLWGRQGGGASLQALHFSYALGAFIAPVIIHPFFAGQHMPLANSSDPFSTVLSSVSPFTESSTWPTAAGLDSPIPAFLRDKPGLDAALQDSEDDLDGVQEARGISYEDEGLVRVPRISWFFEKRAIEEREAFIGDASLNKSLATLSNEELLDLTKPHDEILEQRVPNESSTLSPMMNNVNVSRETIMTTPSNYNSSDTPLPVNGTFMKPLTILNNTKPARPKPSHTGASVKNEDSSQWKKPVQNSPSESNAITTPAPISGSNVTATNSTVEANSSKNHIVETTTVASTTSKSSSSHNESLAQTIMAEASSVSPLSTTVAGVKQAPDSVLTTPVPARVDVTSIDSVHDTPYDAVDALYKLQMSTVESSSPSPTVQSVVGSKIYLPQKPHSGLMPVPVSLTSSHLGLNSAQKTGMMAEQPVDSKIYSDNQMSIHIEAPQVLDLKEPENKVESHSSSPKDEGMKSANASESKGNKMIPAIVRLLKKPGTFSNITDDNKFIETIAQKFKRYGVTKIHLAFICIGIFVLINSMIFVVILCHNPREPRSKQEEGSLDRAPHSRYVLFMVLFSLFMFTAEALEGSIHHLLAANSEGNGLGILEKGIDGPALFWGLVCIVRFLCILFSGCLRLKPGKLLGVSMFLATLGTIFLCIGSFGKDDFLWSGIIVAALGLAPILPTSLLWMAQYMHMTHKMCAIMIILTAFGNSFTHGGLAHVAANSHVYSYVLVIMSLTSMLLLLVSWCLIYFSADPGNSSASPNNRRPGIVTSMDPSSDGYHLARQHEEEDEDIDPQDRMEMSRQSLRRPLSLAESFDEDYMGGRGASQLDRSQHRQLHHMHSLEHEEAGQSLLID